MEVQTKTIPYFPKTKINDLIFYKKNYYKISNIIYDCNIEYKLENIFNNEIISVLSNDRSIEYPKDSSKLLIFLRFAEKYNSTIDYLNLRKNNYSKIDIYSSYILEFEIYKNCNFNIIQFYRIENLLKRIKNNSIELKNLNINPFLFITEEYQLISYDKAEKICQQYKILVDPETKLKAWSYYYFLQMNNSFYVIKTKYINDIKKFTEEKNILLDSVLLKNIEKIIIDKKINNEIYKTTKYLLNSERELTDKILDLFYDEDEDSINEDEINNYILKYENREKKIILENQQKQAVINSIKYKFSIITGPPGTGKTEIIKCINYCFYQIFIHKINTLICDYEKKYSVKFTKDNKKTIVQVIEKEKDDDIDSYIQPCIFYIKDNITNIISPCSISLIAPTGLAYVNMKKSQDNQHINLNISGTCHKVLYHILQSKKINEIHDLNHPKLFIVDETSMLDFFIFRDLLNECKKCGARLILIGDPNQLPSVGPGNILNQLNECNIFPIISLNKIKRQTSGQLIQNILKMKNDIITDSDFIDETMELKHVKQFVKNDRINIQEIINLIDKYNLTIFNSKFITYYNKKYLWNVVHINNILQNIYNLNGLIIPPPSKFQQDYIFRVSDKIIRCENDYSGKIMRANGEEAIILNYDNKKVKISYKDDNIVEEVIEINSLYENFKLNYCVTIHKSQGSQYNNIVFIIQPGQNNIDKKSIYTAISRAKEKCIIISNPNDFIKLQTNQSNNKISLFLEESNKYDITSE
jgi:exodeoxyribonuclease V alpha subunit